MSGERFRRTTRPAQFRSDERLDIREELELYLELRAEELIAEGMDPEEARRVARERFGDAARIEAELERQARRRRAKEGTRMTMGALVQDLGYAVRTFRRNPGFTLVACVTLALAVGGVTAVFSVVDAALLRAMPFEDHEELVFINGYHLTNGEIAIRGASFPEFRDWEARSGTVTPMASVGNMSLPATGDGVAESLPIGIVSDHFFEVLRTDAALGRLFTAGEHDRSEASAVVVLSDALWQRRYAGDPGILGRTIQLNDVSWTVVGVTPPGFGGIGLTTDLWIPDAAMPLVGFDPLEQRGSRFLSVIGRRVAGEDDAQAELDAIAADLQVEYPDAHEDRWAQVQPFRDAYLDTTANLLWLLLAAGGVLLLIAAANVTNLLLVRSHGRTREIVLRQALGAEGRRIGAQLLTEGAVLTALGGVLGLGVAWAGLAVLGPMIPAGVLPGYVDVGLSLSTFAFLIAVLGAVATVVGLAPAVMGSRLQIAPTLREGGRAATGSLRRLRAHHGFVVTQIALALVLLSGAGLLTRSFTAQMAIDTGSEIDRVAAVRMSLRSERYADAESRTLFAVELQREASALPGVTSASVASRLPFRGGSSGAYVFKDAAPDERIRFHMHMVDPSYFETLGVQLVAGRLPTQADDANAPPVGVISEAMVERVFPGESPIGQTMYTRPGRESGFEVIGVIEDRRYRDLTTSLMAEANSPDVFFPLAQFPPGTMELAVNVEGDPAAYVEELRALVARLDPDLPVFDPAPLREAYERLTATPRFAAFLMGLFSVVATLLACVGIYGVLAFSVAQRSQEIAIRRAIGASSMGVARSVVGDGLKLAAVGLGIGAVVALASGRVYQSILYDVQPTDPTTLALVIALMLAVALVASLLPASRAMGRDPAEVLSGD